MNWYKKAAEVFHYNEDADFDDEDYFQGTDIYDVADQADKVFENAGIRPDNTKELAYVSMENGEVTGGVFNSWHDSEYSFYIAIMPEHRGKGNIFKELLDAAMYQYEFDKEAYGDEARMRLWVVNPKLVRVLENKYGFEIEEQHSDGSAHMKKD
jgi:GNAT superfamily N-acetyltransferase